MKPAWERAPDLGARLVFEAILEAADPIHLGGADPDATGDRPLARDGDGRPYLAATGLVGVLRSRYRELVCAGAVATNSEDSLFGSRTTERALQSRLMARDGRVLQAVVETELRDGVRIDPCSGIAADKKKFDLELLPVGTQFGFWLEVDLPCDEAEASRLTEATVRLLAHLEEGSMAVGGRTRRGLGTLRVATVQGQRWRLGRFDMRSERGLVTWIREALDPNNITRTTHEDATGLATALGVKIAPATRSHQLSISLDLDLAGSLIVRSGGHAASEPDAVHLRRRVRSADGDATFEPIVPGTSLAGVLRHHVLRIARTLSVAAGGLDALERLDDLVDDLFGKTNSAGRVQIRDGVIRGGSVLRHTRVRIDPWTGGASDSLLFTEDLQYGGSMKTSLTVAAGSRTDRDRADAALALLLLALRDLARGDLAAGGEAGVGRGRFKAPSRPFATLSGVIETCLAMHEGRVVSSSSTALVPLFEGLGRVMKVER